MKNDKKCLLSLPLILGATLSVASGQDLIESLEPLTVIGGDEELFDLPGSGTVRHLRRPLQSGRRVRVSIETD